MWPNLAWSCFTDVDCERSITTATGAILDGHMCTVKAEGLARVLCPRSWRPRRVFVFPVCVGGYSSGSISAVEVLASAGLHFFGLVPDPTRHYETCCNGTCCNDFSQRCLSDIQETVDGTFDGRQPSPRPLNLTFIRPGCSEMAALTPDKAVYVIGVPLIFGLGTIVLGVLACTGLFLFKRSREYWGLLEVINTALAFLITTLALFYYLNATWYYGFLMVFVALGTLGATHANGNTFSLKFALGMQYMLLLLLVNPFYPNFLLTFGPEGGILRFMGFFRVDTDLTDARITNPEIRHYQLCSREYLVFLTSITFIIILIVLVLQFITVGLLVQANQKTARLEGLQPIQVERTKPHVSSRVYPDDNLPSPSHDQDTYAS
eukprot:gene4247-769_t